MLHALLEADLKRGWIPYNYVMLTHSGGKTRCTGEFLSGLRVCSPTKSHLQYAFVQMAELLSLARTHKRVFGRRVYSKTIIGLSRASLALAKKEWRGLGTFKFLHFHEFINFRFLWNEFINPKLFQNVTYSYWIHCHLSLSPPLCNGFCKVWQNEGHRSIDSG